MIRLLGVLLWIVPATSWFGGRMIWAVFRGSPDVRCICRESPRGWARQLLWLSGVDVVIENLDVIDSERPQILVANHSSWYDVLVLLSVPGTSLFVAKKELSRVPIFGRAIGGCGHIFIDRQDRNAAVQSLAGARELLEKESP
ncbi:MAG: lysophospholipid acyltransferase family protein, partial [Longimicrobiales bacterium]|nr:lysophospholipid acyltransferase family protein [Longimicrobiales bacterium]